MASMPMRTSISRLPWKKQDTPSKRNRTGGHIKRCRRTASGWSWRGSSRNSGTSGLSSLKQYCLPGGASRLAALLLPQILAVFSIVAPCHPGAALRNPVLLQRGQALGIYGSRISRSKDQYLLNPPAPNHHVTIVKHHRLSGRHGDDRRIELDRHPVVVESADGGVDRLMAVTDLRRDAYRLCR